MKLAGNAKKIFSGRVVGLGLGRQAFAGSGLVAILCMQAFAGPEGERVVHGSAQFARSGNNTVIQAANNTIIDYRSFNIGANESVQFVQPSAAARVLNRVPNSVNPTRIDGSLRANGIVYIVNSAGVYFGNRAVVNAAGLYAAAGQITNQDFLNNVNHFTSMTGTVSNAGTINAGAVALLGKHAENLGTINAERGLVTMAAGNDVYVGELGGTFMVQVSGAGGEASATPGVNNAGTINAPGGNVHLAAGDMYSLALKMPGRVMARNVKLEAQGNGTAIVSGTIDASSRRAGERGGNVQVLGDRVGLAGATIDASGPAGGGNVLIGGDFQGRGDVHTASQTVVTSGTTIRADATERGDAGKVVVWSNDTTVYHGSISAQGGPEGGDGGFVEVSGKKNLDFSGSVNMHAPDGRAGTLLLDPDNIIVADTGADDGQIGGADGDINFPQGGGATFTISDEALESVTGNIVLQANVDITVNQALLLINQGAGESVTFQAGDDITINAPITTNGASISFTANDDPTGAPTPSGNGSITINALLNTAGVDGVAGGITLNVAGGTGIVQLGADLQTDGGDVVIAETIEVTADNLTIDTEAGDNHAAGDINLTGSTIRAITGSASLFSLTLDASSAGAAAGDITLGAVNGTGGAFLNDLTLVASGTTSGRINLTGDISVDSNGGDLASVSMTGSGAVLNASIAIDTEQGNDGAAGTIDFSGAPLSASAFGFDLTLHTNSGGGAGGAVTLGAINNTLGTAFINDVNIDTDGSSDGALALGGNISIDANAADVAAFTVAGGGNVVISSDVTIDTEAGNDGNGGGVSLGPVSASGPGFDLTINTGTGFGGGTGGAVSLGAVNNAGGGFINDLSVVTTAATSGRIDLTGNISVDTNGGDLSSVSMTGSGVVLNASVTIDTEAGDDGSAGTVDFSGAPVSATGAGSDLTINTSTAAGGAAGGTVTLGTFNSALGSAFVNDLTINTNGATDGAVSLRGDISLDNSGGDAGDFTVTGGGNIIDGRLGGALVIDTEQGGNGIGGAVDFGASVVSGSAGATDLTIASGGTTTAGTITLGGMDNAGGAFLNNVAISADAATDGNVRIGGNISLDDDAGAASSLAFNNVTIAIFTASTIIDTEQGNSANGGSVNFGSAIASGSTVGLDLTINTGTGFGGGTGGAVTLGFVNNAGGAFLNDLSVVTTGATSGQINLTGNIAVDTNAGDLSSVSMTGSGAVLNTTIFIDTEQGDDANAGTVDLSGAPLSATAAGTDLSIITSTAFGGGVAGGASLGAMNNTGGAFLNDVAVAATGATTGVLTLAGVMNLDTNGGDASSFTFTSGRVQLGASTTIDTEQGNNAAAGAVNLGTTGVSATGAGFDLTINTATSSGTGAGGAISLPTFDNTGGFYVNDLALARSGGNGTHGLISLGGDVFLDNSGVDSGDLTVADAGSIVFIVDRTIDTEQGNDGAGGAINMAPATVTIALGGIDLTLDSSTAAAGANGGAVALPGFSGGAGVALHDLNVMADAGAGGTGGVLTLGSSIQLDGGSLSVTGASAVTLAGNTTIDTDLAGGAGNAGNVSLPASATINGANSLTIDVSADGGGTSANINLLSTLGNSTRLTNLTLTGAAIDLGAAHVSGNIALTANDIDLVGGAATVDSNGGTGTLTIEPTTAGTSIRIGAAGPGTLVLDATDIAAIGTFAGGVFIGRTDGTALTSVNSASFSNDTTIRQEGVGGSITVLPGATVTTTGGADLSFLAGTGNAGAFTQGAAATINAGAGAITILCDSIDLLGGFDSINATAGVHLRPNTAGRPIVLGDPGTASDYALDDAEILTFAVGNGGVNVGSMTSGNMVTIGALTINGGLSVMVPATGGRIRLNGTLTAGGDVTLIGPGMTMDLFADIITTNNADITIMDSVIVHGPRQLLVTGAGAGGNITITGVVNGAGGADSLVMATSGTMGNITLGDDVGTTARLVGLVMTAPGTVSIGGDLLVTGGGGVDFTSSPNIVFTGDSTVDTDDAADGAPAGSILFAAGSAINTSGATALILDATASGGAANGNIVLGTVGAVTRPTTFHALGQSVTLNGNISNAGETIIGLVTGTVTLNAAAVIDNTAGTDNAITVHHVSGNFGLALTGDAASQLTLTGADVDSLALTGGNLLLSGTIETDTAQDYTNVGAIMLQGATTLIAQDSDAANAPQDIITDAGNVITGGFPLTVTGDDITLVAVGDMASDPSGFTVTGAGNVTLGDVSVATATITADSDMNGAGTLTFSSGSTFSVLTGTVNMMAADVVIDGLIAAPMSAVRIERSANGSIGVGDATGDMTISKVELGNITASALTIGGGTKSVNITVDNVAEADVDGVTGGFTLDATGAGATITFQNAASTFRNVTAIADGGIQVNTNLTTTVGDLVLDADFDDAPDSGDVLALGATRTLTSAGALTLSATTGDITGGGMIVLNAANGVTINDSFAVGGALTVDSDTNDDGTGTTTIAAGAAVNTAGADASITAADVVLDGSLNAGAGTIGVARSTLGAIRIGGTSMAGELGISGAELQGMTAAGLTVGGATTDLIQVEAIAPAQSAGISGVTQLNATANNGMVRFITGASTFSTLSVTADDGIVVDQDVTTTTGDMSLNANSDGVDDNDDSITIAGDADLTSGNDLLLVGNAITLTGAAGTTNSFTSGADGNVNAGSIAGPSSPNLTINSQNNITLGTVSIAGGAFSAVVDSNANAVATLATSGVTAGMVDLAGGADNNDIVDVNLSIAGANGVSIHNAATVNISGAVTISSTGGNISLGENVLGVVLTGADNTLVSISSTTGNVRVSPVTSTNNPDLTISTDGTATLSAIDVNTGDLIVDAAVTGLPGSEIAFSGGTITLNNSITTAGLDITMDGPVILTGPVTLDTGAGAGDITFTSTVRSDSDSSKRALTLNAGTGSISAAGAMGEGGSIDQLIIQLTNNATFAGNITANTVRQIAGTGTSTFQGAVISQGPGGIDMDGNAFVFQGGIVTAAQGAGFTITNGGALDIQSNSTVALNGAFIQDGTGPVNLAASITTSLAPISFEAPVTISNAITINNNGAGDITFGGSLTTSMPVTIDSGSAGTGNINFNGSVASMGELIARTGTGSITFVNGVTANSALTASTSSGAITFNGPLSVMGALSATSSSTGTISFAGAVTTGSAFVASTQSGNIQFNGAVNGSTAGSGIINLNAGTGNVVFNSGANVGGTTAVQRFSATGRNITVRGITTQGTTASGDGDITLTPDLTVTQNPVTEVPGQIETDNRPNGLVSIFGNLVANNGDINIGAAGRTVIPSVATTIVGSPSVSGNLPTFTIAANGGNVNFGKFDKLTAFGNLSLVGVNVTISDVASLGVLSVNAGNTITLLQRAGALLVRPGPGGTDVRNQVDFGSNIVANGGIGFTAPNVVVSGAGNAPSFAASNGVGQGIPLTFPLAIRSPFGAADLVGSNGVVLGIDSTGTTNTGLASALANAVPRDTGLGDVAGETTALGRAEKDQLRELRINPRDLRESELQDFLSGRALYQDITLDPNAAPDDYLVAVNRLPFGQVVQVLETYREVFKKPRINPDTGEQMTDPETGKALYEDRDREIRDDLAAALRRFRREGREGTLDPVEFRRYLERTPEESTALGHVENMQKFFEQLELLGLGPKEADNSKRTILGRVCPRGLPVQQLEETIKAKPEDSSLMLMQ